MLSLNLLFPTHQLDKSLALNSGIREISVFGILTIIRGIFLANRRRERDKRKIKLIAREKMKRYNNHTPICHFFLTILIDLYFSQFFTISSIHNSYLSLLFVILHDLLSISFPTQQSLTTITVNFSSFPTIMPQHTSSFLSVPSSYIIKMKLYSLTTHQGQFIPQRNKWNRKLPETFPGSCHPVTV